MKESLYLDCIHCGLCLNACPTYVELGVETDSPRGRIHLMRAMLEGRLEPDEEAAEPLDRCLGCRACETACPSAVHYGALLEHVRAEVLSSKPTGRKRWWRWILNYMLPYPRRLRWALLPARLLRRVFPVLGRSAGPQGAGSTPGLLAFLTRQLTILPDTQPASPLRAFTPARGERRGTVALLSGCAMDAMYSQVHHATIRMLARAGFDVVVPANQGCCGALHLHEGESERAKGFIRQNLRAFEGDFDAIITNSAGCGAAMKEYPAHFGDTADTFSAKVRDISEFLAEVGIPQPDKPLRRRIAYHDPCHLAHGQKVREAPRALLKQLNGIDWIDLPESDWCCGGAGSYAVLQPELSERMLERKMGHVRAIAPDIVVTGNPSCLMQLGLGARREGRYEILHTVELLDRAYST